MPATALKRKKVLALNAGQGIAEVHSYCHDQTGPPTPYVFFVFSLRRGLRKLFLQRPTAPFSGPGPRTLQFWPFRQFLLGECCHVGESFARFDL